MRTTSVLARVLLLAATGWTSSIYANGYKILCVKSAKATGMAEAFIVQADDPSAIAFNPAGLAQLRGLQLNLHGTLCNAYTEHRSPEGVTTDNEDSWQLVPSFFLTTDLGRDDLAVGLGVSLPNGLSNEWADDSSARYVATYSDLIVSDISASLGVRVRDRLMLGCGVSFYYSEAVFESMVDAGLGVGAPGMFDAERTLDGDGTAWGFNLGAIYEISPRHSVALTYRHPFAVEYDGELEIAGLLKTDATASIDFPGVVVAGYAFRPNDKWKLEVNVDWTNWEKVDRTMIRAEAPGVPDMPLRWDLKNSVAYKFGAEYQYSESLALRCGYIYNQNATPEEAWRPSLPDTDTHFFTLGFGYDFDNWTIDAALQLVYYETRRIDNNVDLHETLSSSSIAGTYRTWAPCASVSVTYRF